MLGILAWGSFFAFLRAAITNADFTAYYFMSNVLLTALCTCGILYLGFDPFRKHAPFLSFFLPLIYLPVGLALGAIRYILVDSHR